MTAPQAIATVFFLVSLGSVLMLAVLTAVSAALEAVEAACRAGHAVRSGSLTAACLAHRTVRARFDLQSQRPCKLDTVQFSSSARGDRSILLSE